MEFSNIPNDIADNQLEDKVKQICRELEVEVDQNDIEIVIVSLLQDIVKEIAKG